MRLSNCSLFALATLLVASPAFAKQVQVSIAKLKYNPATVEVTAGDTIVWTNDDDRGHTVVADDGSFSSGEIGLGKTYQSMFAKVGEFPYHCEHHPRMRGKVVVKAK